MAPVVGRHHVGRVDHCRDGRHECGPYDGTTARWTSMVTNNYNDVVEMLFKEEQEEKLMQIRILGVPMDLGADRRGVDIGPSAIRYANLQEQLQRIGHTVQDKGNLFVPQPESHPTGHPHVKYLDPIVQV